MNPQGRIPRSRGGICGVLMILLGLWGGLAPFVGPYFHFGYTPDKVWAYSSGRLYYSAIPGAAALIGGLLVVATRHRGVGIAGGVLGALGGAWFVAGGGFVLHVLKRTSINIGAPILTANSGQPLSLRSYLETIALFTGLGIVLLFLGALAIGRFSMVSARDIEAGDGDGYYAADYPSAQPVSQPSLSQYGSSTTTGQFPSTPVGQVPAADPFPPAPYPDTTTSPFPPSG